MGMMQSGRGGKAILLPPLHPRALVYLTIAIALMMATSVAGAQLTADALPNWYVTLNKPWFTPPNLAFPIAWTLIFSLMAIALWRVLRTIGDQTARRAALAAFGVQLAFNVGWSAAFFWLRSPLFGLLVVVGLWLSIAWTILAFRRVDRPAAMLLWPYIAWVSFAAVLNAAIVWINL
jgi:tryptophan-rich sensory protein